MDSYTHKIAAGSKAYLRASIDFVIRYEREMKDRGYRKICTPIPGNENGSVTVSFVTDFRPRNKSPEASPQSTECVGTDSSLETASSGDFTEGCSDE